MKRQYDKITSPWCDKNYFNNMQNTNKRLNFLLKTATNRMLLALNRLN